MTSTEIQIIKDYLQRFKSICNLNIASPDVKTGNVIKTLIVTDGYNLFVWNSHKNIVFKLYLPTKFNNLLNLPIDSCGQQESNGRSFVENLENVDRNKYQRLLCSNPPKFEVNSLLLSPTNDYLAVYGFYGITIIELPVQHHGRKIDLNDEIICRCISVAERELIDCSGVKVLQVRWHPGSPCGSHVVVLFSISIINVYDVMNPEFMTKHISLSEQVGPTNFPLSFISAALGESAVSFDFGSPVTMTKTGHECSSFSRKNSVDLETWPMYILKGNGDVLITYLDLDFNNPDSPVAPSILSMYPPAEDNYGTDACFLICLKSEPEVLVIATSTGCIYHCLVLPNAETEDVNNADCTWTSDHSNFLKVNSRPLPSLYVYETVELELSLVEADDTIVINCPIHLVEDRASSDQYHCFHSSGVHTIQLTWLSDVVQFCNSIGAIHSESLQQVSVVEHVLCTKPFPSNQPSPIIGLSLLPRSDFGSCLLVMMVDYTFEVFFLRSRHRRQDIQLMSDSPRKLSTGSELQLRNEPFHEYISRILERKTSIPLLRTVDCSSFGQQQCYNLLSRVTHFFREEYIVKQEVCLDNIRTRIGVLKEQKKQQEMALQVLLESCSTVHDDIERTAKKYREIYDVQESLMQRIHDVTKQVQVQVPSLSNAEKKLLSSLSAMLQRVDTYRSRLKMLQLKWEHQSSLINQQPSSKTSAIITGNQSKSLKSILNHQGKEIAELMKSINSLKTELNM